MIVIDMQMPTNCLDCPACNEYLMCAIPVNGRKWGENDVREYGQSRPEWCPMKEREAVEPKTGHWIQSNPKFVSAKATGGSRISTCSNCGKWGRKSFSFCPHCGAKMEGR